MRLKSPAPDVYMVCFPFQSDVEPMLRVRSGAVIKVGDDAVLHQDM